MASEPIAGAHVRRSAGHIMDRRSRCSWWTGRIPSRSFPVKQKKAAGFRRVSLGRTIMF
jgi:hypothetical protein